MRISHKVDYGLRAMVTLARSADVRPHKLLVRDLLAEANHIPPKFLQDILRCLRTSGMVTSTRGADGGWALTRPADDITVADVIRALEGPLATVRGIRPHELVEDGVDETYASLWVAVRTALRSVLEEVTIAHLASGRLPDATQAWLLQPAAWDAS